MWGRCSFFSRLILGSKNCFSMNALILFLRRDLSFSSISGEVFIILYNSSLMFNIFISSICHKISTAHFFWTSLPLLSIMFQSWSNDSCATSGFQLFQVFNLCKINAHWIWDVIFFVTFLYFRFFSSVNFSCSEELISVVFWLIM